MERKERVEAEQVQTLTSRTIQTNHRESKGKIFDEKSFAKIGGRHQLLFRGSALKPQQAAFGKVDRVQNRSDQHLAFRGEPLT